MEGDFCENQLCVVKLHELLEKRRDDLRLLLLWVSILARKINGRMKK
jgi:hypothetical protein